MKRPRAAAIGLVTTICAMVALPVLAQPLLSFEPVSVVAGETAVLKLNAYGALDPYLGVNVKFALPSGVSVVSVAPGELLSSEYVVDSHSLVENETNVQTAFAYSIFESIPVDDGTLLEFTVQVSDDLVEVGLGDAVAIDQDVAFLSSGIAASDALTSIDHAVADGTMTITAHLIPVLAVSPPSRTPDASAGEASFSVANIGAGDMPWTASVTEGGSWLSIASGLSALNAGDITVSYSQNTSADARTATVIVNAGDTAGSPAAVTVTQAGSKTPTLTVTPLDVEVPASSGIVEVQVANTGNGTMSWESRVIQGTDWLTVSSGSAGVEDGVIELAHGVNTSEVVRSALVEVRAEGAVGSPTLVTVTQSVPAVLSVTPAEQATGPTGGSVEFQIANLGSGTFAWTAQVVSGVEWLTISSGSSGTGDGTIVASCTVNEAESSRTGTIEVHAPGVLGSPTSVTVSQGSPTTPLLSVRPTEQTVDADATGAEFAVANMGGGILRWTASVVDADWLTISSGASGTGDGVIWAGFSTNDATGTRSGVIRVSADGADGSPVDVTLTQRTPVPLEVLTPNGGESWKRGDTETIVWRTSNTKAVESVSILLVKGGNDISVISQTTYNTGSYEWTIPADTAPGDDYAIQIIDVANAAVHDESDTDFFISCPPDAPQNVSATDGVATHVTVTWDAIDTADAYEVYRGPTESANDATLIETTTTTMYQDFDAPAPKPSALGCRPTPAMWYYWVKAVNVCDTSEYSNSDTGYRTADPVVFETVLPPTIFGKTQRAADLLSALSIRLRGDDAIDPESVWGWVSKTGFESADVNWLPITENDGWVVYEPDTPWEEGDIVEMSAGATDVNGDEIGPITYQFRVVDKNGPDWPALKAVENLKQPRYDEFESGAMDLSMESNESVSVSIAADGPGGAELSGTVGPRYLVGPERPYELPQRVWLPVPKDVDPDDVSVWYHHPVGSDAGWYRAEEIVGWLTSGECHVLELDGTTYIGFLVGHSGTVQLRITGDSHLAGLAAQAAVMSISRGSLGVYSCWRLRH